MVQALQRLLAHIRKRGREALHQRLSRDLPQGPAQVPGQRDAAHPAGLHCVPLLRVRSREAVLPAGRHCPCVAAHALGVLEAVEHFMCTRHHPVQGLLPAEAAAGAAALPTLMTWTATWPWMQPTGSSRRPSSGDVRPLAGTLLPAAHWGSALPDCVKAVNQLLVM